jgi:hypothetical protein
VAALIPVFERIAARIFHRLKANTAFYNMTEFSALNTGNCTQQLHADSQERCARREFLCHSNTEDELHSLQSSWTGMQHGRMKDSLLMTFLLVVLQGSECERR